MSAIDYEIYTVDEGWQLADLHGSILFCQGEFGIMRPCDAGDEMCYGLSDLIRRLHTIVDEDTLTTSVVPRRYRLGRGSVTSSSDDEGESEESDDPSQ